MKKSFGLTFVEILLVVGISILLLSGSVLFLGNYFKTSGLSSEALQIVAALRKARDFSISQEQGNQWGVYFDNPLSGNDFYAIFSGTSYSTGSTIYRKNLNSEIQFSAPATGASTTILFSKMTGLPQSSSSIIIFLAGATSSSSTISINSLGEIIY